MDRRTFLNWVSVGMVAGSLPVALAACTPRSESGSGGSGEFKAIGTVSQLDQDGQLLAESGLANPVLVIRNPTNKDALVAVNPTCTHAGCDVKWEAATSIFVCPCHNSRFDAQGAVTQGPARQSLAVYDAKIEGEQIMVKET